MPDPDQMLTIILLTYNHAPSIASALDSVLEQQTIYPYQIWLCDDCSTDGTLEICQDYARRYPDTIRLFPQPVNTFSNPEREFHLVTALKNVRSRYFCALEGDDAWSDPKKIQLSLDTLEANPDYVVFAHDTLVNDLACGTKKSLIHEVLHLQLCNPITFETAPLFHTSARIYRNIIPFTDKTNYSDIFVFYSFLDRGSLYYMDRIMSVYNSTGKGMWSRLSKSEGLKLDLLLCGMLNQYFNYKYDELFTLRAGNPTGLRLMKKLLGRQKAWDKWIRSREIRYHPILEKLRQNRHKNETRN
jgi:glycosyltransferase involved in cell wall biosynthesis